MSNQDQARALLKRIADDAEFRKAVETNPAETLSEYGFKLDPANLPKQPIQLPSSQDIHANLDRLSGDLAAGMAIIFFEA